MLGRHGDARPEAVKLSHFGSRPPPSVDRATVRAMGHGSSENAPPQTFLRKHAAGYPSGTGSAGTLPMSEEEKKAVAEKPKPQVGFVADERPEERQR